MYNVITHPAALDELKEFPDDVRGIFFCIIERLKTDGKFLKSERHYLGPQNNEWYVGPENMRRTLHVLKLGNSFNLTHAFLKETQHPPAAAIATISLRLNQMIDKFKGIPFDTVRAELLNTLTAKQAYTNLDRELAIIEIVRTMRERAGLSVEVLAEKMGIQLSDVTELERDPLSTSSAMLMRFARACSTHIDFRAIY